MRKEQPCGVVRDLLPLYADGGCSQSTEQLVKEHIGLCSECRKTLASLQAQKEPEPIVEEAPAVETALKKARKRTRQRVISAGLTVLMACLVGMLAVNQVRQQGVAFTNVDDILTARRVLLVWQQEGMAAFVETLNPDGYDGALPEECDVELEDFNYYGVYQTDRAQLDSDWNVQWLVSLSNGCQGILTLRSGEGGLHTCFTPADNSDTEALSFFQALNENIEEARKHP